MKAKTEQRQSTDSVEPLEPLIPLADAGRFLGLGVSAVRQRIWQGELRAIRIGIKGKIFIEPAEIRRFRASLPRVGGRSSKQTAARDTNEPARAPIPHGP